MAADYLKQIFQQQPLDTEQGVIKVSPIFTLADVTDAWKHLNPNKAIGTDHFEAKDMSASLVLKIST